MRGTRAVRPQSLMLTQSPTHQGFEKFLDRKLRGLRNFPSSSKGKSTIYARRLGAPVGDLHFCPPARAGAIAADQSRAAASNARQAPRRRESRSALPHVVGTVAAYPHARTPTPQHCTLSDGPFLRLPHSQLGRRRYRALQQASRPRSRGAWALRMFTAPFARTRYLRSPSFHVQPIAVVADLVTRLMINVGRSTLQRCPVRS